MIDILLPEFWMQLEPVPTDEVPLRADLLLARDDLRWEFFHGTFPDIHPSDVTHHLVEISTAAGDIITTAEFFRVDGKAWLAPTWETSSLNSVKFWKARPVRYVEVLLIAAELW